jgi:hypothetical protein
MIAESNAIVDRPVASGHGRTPVGFVAFLVVCATAGAALGAGAHPQPADRFRASAVVAVNASTPALQSVTWHTFARAIELPALRAQIAALVGQDASALRIGSRGDAQSSLITVYADASTPARADKAANTAVTVALEFLRDTVLGSTVADSTFEESTEGWDQGPGVYVLPPQQLQRTALLAHSGSHALAVTCMTVVVGGCGPYLVMSRPFQRGIAYTARGWIKAPRSTRVRLVLGSTPQDVAVGATTAGGNKWKLVTVNWTPRTAVTHAVTTFQIMSIGASRFYVDDIEVGPLEAVQRGVSPGGARGPYRAILPATATPLAQDAHTALWTAGGAGGGLVIGGIALTAGLAAARKRTDRPEPD